MRLFLVALMALSLCGAVRADQPMTVERLFEIAAALDPQAVSEGGMLQMTIEDLPVVIVTDADANRMRVITPIRQVSGLTEAELTRLMQANFDTALDARYAVAQDLLWSAFIHPLEALQKDEFIEGVGQVVNLALTYGSTYSSGLLSFGGGDSGEILRRRALIDELLKKGEEI